MLPLRGHLPMSTDARVGSAGRRPAGPLSGADLPRLCSARKIAYDPLWSSAA
jgi:hypothetical protein